MERCASMLIKSNKNKGTHYNMLLHVRPMPLNQDWSKRGKLEGRAKQLRGCPQISAKPQVHSNPTRAGTNSSRNLTSVPSPACSQQPAASSRSPLAKLQPAMPLYSHHCSPQQPAPVPVQPSLCTTGPASAFVQPTSSPCPSAAQPLQPPFLKLPPTPRPPITNSVQPPTPPLFLRLILGIITVMADSLKEVAPTHMVLSPVLVSLSHSQPTQHITSVLLNGKNFHAWSRSFQLYPSGKRKTRWILKKEPKPAEAPTALHGKSGHPTWILDFGANNHMTGELATFTSPVTSVNQSVCIADGSSIPIRSQGDARLSSNITLSSVYHDLSSKKIFGRGYERDGLYYFGDLLPSHPGSEILAADDPIPPRPLPILEPPSSPPTPNGSLPPFASQDPSPRTQAPLPVSSPESGMGFSMTDSSYLFCDNKLAIMLSSDSVLHERTKHIEVDIHFIREKVRSGVITPSFVPSYAQTADMFTKSIGPSLLKSSLVKLGLIDIFASA
ncbi:hypothetical protein Acr_02g0014260 [Actinidia rufa]|uniref:Retrovirus-related Pol polyprotein from transposon TNT 1-94-like beta-barrel domain-containing protein n=1 Tax=Actinidia rufa TaxID=165716 RepID=A0A7J0EAH3_9ERIC|nr:hypothetical protein Acr_02g0014260 [Actinidia rufa]